MFNRSNGAAAPPTHRVDTSGLAPESPRAPVPRFEDRYDADRPPPRAAGVEPVAHLPLAEAEDGLSREVPLSRVYQAHGEPLARIRFRKPATRDIRTIGNPFKMHIRPLPNGDQVIENVDVDYDKLAKLVHVLAIPPIPPSTVDSFDLVDLDECGEALLGAFFMTRSTFKLLK